MIAKSLAHHVVDGQFWLQEPFLPKAVRSIALSRSYFGIPFRTFALRTLFNATDTVCPASALSTFARLRCMLFTLLASHWPLPSGPSSTASPAWIAPALIIPLTTTPTYGTDQTSVIEY